MAVAYKEYSTASGSANPIVIPRPTNLAIGDLMIAHISVDYGGTNSITPPSGWTNIYNAIWAAAQGNAYTAYKFAKYADTIAASFSFDKVQTTNAIGFISTFTGVDTGDPIGDSSTQNPNVWGYTGTAPTITPPVNNCMIVLLGSNTSNAGTFSGWAIATSDPGLVEKYDGSYNPGSSPCSAGMACAVRSQSTATGSGTVTQSSIGYQNGTLLALQPRGTTQSSSSSGSTSSSSSSNSSSSKSSNSSSSKSSNSSSSSSYDDWEKIIYSGGTYVLTGSEFSLVGTTIRYNYVNNTAILHDYRTVTELYCIGKGLDGNLDVSNCNTLYAFDCSNNSLNTLTLTGCTSLAYLTCSGNPFTSLDVSNLALENLATSSCPNLANIDISNNTVLASLDVSSLALTTLTLTGCTSLAYLTCSYNPLVNLDASGLALVYFDATSCPLSNLNLSNNPLPGLDFSAYDFSTLNLSNCPNMDILYCQDNLLTSLDVSNCAAFIYLIGYNNLLNELAVDKILLDLVTTGNFSGICYLNGTGNEGPTDIGLIDAQTLIDRGWDVQLNGPATSSSSSMSEPSSSSSKSESSTSSSSKSNSSESSSSSNSSNSSSSSSLSDSPYALKVTGNGAPNSPNGYYTEDGLYNGYMSYVNTPWYVWYSTGGLRYVISTSKGWIVDSWSNSNQSTSPLGIYNPVGGFTGNPVIGNAPNVSSSSSSSNSSSSTSLSTSSDSSSSNSSSSSSISSLEYSESESSSSSLSESSSSSSMSESSSSSESSQSESSESSSSSISSESISSSSSSKSESSSSTSLEYSESSSSSSMSESSSSTSLEYSESSSSTSLGYSSSSSSESGFTLVGYLCCEINGSNTKNHYIELDSFNTTGYTPSNRDFWGDIVANPVNLQEAGYLSMIINGNTYWFKVYTADPSSDCCTTLVGTWRAK